MILIDLGGGTIFKLSDLVLNFQMLADTLTRLKVVFI